MAPTAAYYVGKTIYITGGASGIGAELSQQLLRFAPKTIVLLDLASNVATLAEQLGNGSSTVCLGVQADTTNEQSVSGAFAQAASQAGAPDIVIHCAGINKAALFMAQSSADFNKVMDVNFVGTTHVARAAHPYLLESQGHFAIIASLAGITPNYGYSAYAASKAATIMFGQALRTEWQQEGITISVICPPEIPTPLVTQERGEAHPLTTQLKLIVGVVPLSSACEKMLAQIAKRKFMIIISWRARATAWVQGAAPMVNQLVTDSIIRRYFKKHSRQ